MSATLRRASALPTPRPPAHPVPEVDEYDLLRFDGRWLALAPSEARVVRVLLPRIGRCVPRTELARALGGDDARLRSAVKRLRAKIAGHGLHITTVRGRGLVLSIVNDSRALSGVAS